MALDEYRRKRDFTRTPEPPGDTVSGEARGPVFEGWAQLEPGYRFCVQMHAARRLHWDLRLERGGVLLSWAVPRGPSLDPTARRLAVHVEDHPVAYGPFEGVIPSGYGTGSVILWDAGTVEWVRESAEDWDAAMGRGDVKFRLAGVRLNGEFALVRTGGRGRGGASADQARQWLLIKKRDAAARPGMDAATLTTSIRTGRTLAEVAADAQVAADAPVADATPSPVALDPAVLAAPHRRLPVAVDPMLATAIGEPFSRTGWFFELKYDGIRCIAAVRDGTLALRARSGRDETARYPELSALRSQLRADAVLDGEVVALDPSGLPSFERLQRRINSTGAAEVRSLSASVPATYMVFDVLEIGGHDVRELPLAERKRLLRWVLSDGPTVRYADHVEDRGDEFFAAVRSSGAEGIVAKDALSRYESGRRSTAWLKVRAWRQQDCVVGGWTAGRGGRGALGALILGVREGDALVPCGRVGSGLDASTLDALLRRLEELRTDHCPFVRRPTTDQKPTWVRPELVCSVRHIGWTASGTLRHPTFRGLRQDVDAAGCVREDDLTATSPPRPPEEPETAAAAAGSGASSPARHPRSAPSREVATTTSAGSDAEMADAIAILDRMGSAGVWTIGDRRLRLGNLDKPLWPDGTTKRDLVRYYATIAPVLLPYLRDRPVGMQVFPDGIAGKHFWRKRIPDHAPAWIRSWTHHGETEVTYVLADEPATLVWMAQSAVIDIHPWHSRVDLPTQPDWAIFDLDPFPPATFADVVVIAKLVRAALDHFGLRGYPKTTGQTGLQIYVPIDRGPSQDAVRSWVEAVALAIGRVEPDRVSWEWAVARRAGKLRIDYTQNVIGKTLAAPYSVRPAPGAPVSMPVSWDELDDPSLRPERWTIRDAAARLADVGDLFAPVLLGGQSLPL